MASLQQIISWFKEGLYPTENQFKDAWTSFWHKSEKIPQEQVFGLKETIEASSKGLIYQNPVTTKTELSTTYPNPLPGWASLVQDEGYIYSWNGNDWANTGLKAFPEDVAMKEELVQLAGNVDKKVYPPLIGDERFARFVDIWAGTSGIFNKPFRMMICNKGGNTGVLSDEFGQFAISSTKTTGVELFKRKVNNDVLFFAVNWDLDVPNIYIPEGSAETVNATIPKTQVFSEHYNMFSNELYSITCNVVYNADGIIASANVMWQDGKAGTMIHSNYDSNTLQYQDLTVTYNHAELGVLKVIYGKKTFDDLGEIISQERMQITF